MKKKTKIICFLFAGILALCGCNKEKTGLQPQATTLYACRDYAMRICEDGTVEYLYQRDGFAEYISYKTEEPFPEFSDYHCVGIVEGERFEECPEIITQDGRRASENMETAAYWETYIAQSLTPVSLSVEGIPAILRQVENWNDMIQLIGDPWSGYAALKQDGTVMSIGVVSDTQELVEEEWSDIVHIVSAGGIIYALKQDGTICWHVYGGDILDQMQLEKKLSTWKDVIQIKGGKRLFGVTKDGTVLTTATNFYDYKQWTDIVAVAASDYAIVGIKKDGTLAAECRFESGFQEGEFAGWDEIEQVAVCNEYCIAVRRDGTVLKTGEK